MGAEHPGPCSGDGIAGAVLVRCIACDGAEEGGDLDRGFRQMALGGASKGFAPTVKARPWCGAHLCAPSHSWPAGSLASRSPTAHLVWKA